MSATNLLAPGSILGSYQIIEPIAQGGMGVVYRARHRIIKREVALKVLFPHLTGDSEFTQRFEREGQAMAQLRHPNIVEVYDAAFSDGYYYLAMELLPGGTLHQQLARLRVTKQVMPVEQALDITRQIALALDYAHNKGLVHRDIKPSNILIASDGRYVLTDFGIVHTQDATKLTKAVTAMGTPEYMSPEQAQGQPVDGRSDLYSLGIVLYEMIAGRPPFSADTPWATVYQHIKEPPPPITRSRTDIPTPARDIVNKTLAKKPADRYQTGRQLAAAIDQILVVKSAGAGTNRHLILAGIIVSLAVVIGASALAIGTLLASRPAPVASNATNPLLATVTLAPLPTSALAASPTPLAPTALPDAAAHGMATLAPTTASTATDTPAPSPTAAPVTDTPLPRPQTPATVKPTAIAPPTAAPVRTPPKPGQLLNFEQPFNPWPLGDQHYGSFVQSTEQVHDGTYSAKLTYDIPAVQQNFVVFLTGIPLPGQTTGLVAWVYGDGKGNYLHVWIKDSSGQRRQYTFSRVYQQGWQQMVAWFDDARGWPNVHIDGPDGGRLVPPFSLNTIVLDIAADNSAGSGTIFIDEVYVTTQNIPASASTPVPTSIDATAAPVTAPPAASTPLANGTPSVTPSVDFIFRNYTVGREQWGKPTSPDGCSKFENNNVGLWLKYEVNFEIVNTGPTDISSWTPVFISNINKELPKCVNLAGAATIPPGGTTHVAYTLYMQGENLAYIEVRTPAFAKRLCVDDFGRTMSPC